jgi:hypothetical protein
MVDFADGIIDRGAGARLRRSLKGKGARPCHSTV